MGDDRPDRATERYEQAVFGGDAEALAAAEDEACFWVGTFHQVVRGDGDAALPALQRSYTLAQEAGDPLTTSYAVRHLGFHAMEQGHLDIAREQLEESLRRRREVGFRPGVAAALLALAELAAAG